MKDHLTCLGIESTAHTFGAAVVNSKGTILSDIRDMYKKETGGIIPSEAAQHHEQLYHKIIREALEKTIDVINKINDPFEKALIAHLMIPYIQPYVDGNKRTARMLTNAILLAYDLYPLSYRSVDEDEFKKALILFYEQLSIVYIKDLFIEQVKFANGNYFQ